VKKVKVGDEVWKSAAHGGYEGPGHVVSVFKNWMGQDRFVVSHKIANGKGYFYHIYSAKELERQSEELDDEENIVPEEKSE